MLASLLVVSSCQNEVLIESQNGQGQAFTLSASKGMSSRTAIDGNQTVWSAGDKIYVSSKVGKTTGVLTLQGNGGGQTGTFSGFVFGNPSSLAYSVYPAPANGTTLDLSEITGAHQLDAPMIGKINQGEDVDVQFNHTCGVLCVNLLNSTGKNFTITATNNDEPINLAAAADISASKIKWTGEVPSLQFTSNEQTIDVTAAKGGIMYIPYYSDAADLTKVKFFINSDNPLNSATVNLTKKGDFIGTIAGNGILTLDCKNDTYSPFMKLVLSLK